MNAAAAFFYGAALWLGAVPAGAETGAGPLAEAVAVPSGQPVEFIGLIREEQGPMGPTWRFRFVAPQIARNEGKITFETAAADMDYLCEAYAIARLPAGAPRAGRIVISLSDRWVEFGEARPEITQFFEAYSVENDSCIWEGF